MRNSITRIVTFSALSLICLSTATPTQTSGPEAVVEGFVRAFNAHDSVAFGRLFTEDADWVNVVGIRVKGRGDIQAAHEEAFTTYFKRATIAAVSSTVRFVRPDVAVVHCNWELKGQMDTRKEKEVEVPPRRGIILIVAARQESGWKITAGQNTDSIFPEQLWERK